MKLAAVPLVAALLVGCGAVTPPASRSQPPGTAMPPTASAGVSRASSAPETGTFVADRARLTATLETLARIADANGGIRAVGTPGFDASVDAMASELERLGFAVETPSIGYTGFRELPGATLRVGDETFEAPDEVHALIYSAGGDVDGPVSVLAESGCEEDHFAAVPRGALVLTTQGGCYRRQQAVNAIAAGAGALIVGYPGRGPGEIYRPTLIDPEGISIPVVSVTDDAVRALTADGAHARLVVETEREPETLRNVVAQLGDGPAVVMVGGHLDSVLEGPGINDNGSGVAALLEVARGAAEAGIPDGWALRVALWGGEEFGTVGSRAYVEALADDDIVAYLNLDMAGSINGATLVYDEPTAAAGSKRITEAFEAWLAARDEPAERVDLGGASDHFAFQQAGIPTGGLFAGAGATGSAAQPSAGGGGEAPDPCYHLACDDLQNVDLERIALFAEATFHVAYALMD